MAATIQGAFVIIDRASSTMQKMERQALKTQAAIEGVGAAADMQSRRSQTAQRGLEGHTKASRDLEGESSKATKSMRDMGVESQRTSQRVRQLEQALSRMRGELRQLEQSQRRTTASGTGGLGGIKGFKKDLDDVGKAIGGFIGSFGVLGKALSMFKLPAMGAGIGVLVQGIGALGGAVLGFLPDLTALAGGLSALPAVFGVAAQGVGSFMAAMQGVLGAIQAGMQAQNQWGTNQREWSQQVMQAQRAVADAIHGVSDAQFAQQQAVMALNDAYYQHQQSIHTLNEAIYSQTQAQINLTIARRDAIRTLQDMEFQAKTAVLQEARAGLNIRQAQQELQQAMMTPGTNQLQLESDRLAVMEAQASAAQTHTQAVRSRVDYSRAAAGDPTSQPTQQVAQAQHQLASATYGVGQAQHEVALSSRQIAVAQHQVADAAYSVLKAEQGVQQAQFALNTLYIQGNSGVSAYRKQLAALMPIQRQFVQFVVGRMGPGDKNSLLGQIQQLQQAAGEGLFPQLERGLGTLMGAFPMLDRNFRASGDAMGRMATNVVNAFFGPRGIGATNSIMQSNSVVLHTVADAAGHFAGIIRSLMLAAGPLLQWAAQMIDRWAKVHDQFDATAAGQDKLRGRFERFKEVVSGLWRVLSNLWTAFKHVSSAMRPLTEFLNQGMLHGSAHLAALTGQQGTQTRMRNWFTGLIPVLKALGSFARDLGRGFLILTSPKMNKVGAGLIRGLGGLIPVLARIIAQLEQAFGPPVIAALGAFAQAIGGATGKASPFAIWLQIMTLIIKAFAWLLRLPVVGRALVTFLAALFAARTITNYVSKLTSVALAVARIRDRWREAGRAQRAGMASPGTTGRGGGILSRAQYTLGGEGALAAGAEAAKQSHIWGVRSIGGPGSETNPLMVRIEGGGISSGASGNPLAGGSSTLGKAGTVNQAAEDASKLSRVEGIGAWLAGKGAVGRGATRVLSKVPGLGGLASGAAKAAGVVGEVGTAGGLLSKLGPLAGIAGTLGKFAGPVGLALTALPAITAFISGKGTVGQRAGQAASAAASSLTFGLWNPGWGTPGPTPTQRGNQYAARDWKAALAMGTDPLTGTLSQGGLRSLYSRRSSLESQITAIQHPPSFYIPGVGGTTPDTPIDQKTLKARRAELAAINDQISRDQIQAGNVAAQNWATAFQQGVDGGKKPQQAMKQLIGGLGLQVARLNPAGRRSLATSMAAWGQQVVQSNPQLKGPVAALNNWIVGQFRAMGQNIAIVNGDILTGSQQEWQKIGTALTDPVSVAQEKLKGSFGDIEQHAIGSLTAMGFTASDAKNLVKGITSGKIDPKQVGSSGSALSALTTATGSAGTASSILSGALSFHGRTATGGRIVGSDPRDVYRLGGNAVGGGELVLNKWHEMDANARLLRHGEPTVGSIMSSRNTPHWATGVSTLPLGRVKHTPSTGRGRASGGYALPLPRNQMMPGSWSIDMGVDIPAPANTPEYAIASGTIIQEGISGFGPNAPVLHLDTPIGGYANIYYGHAGRDTVPVGTHVGTGQQISEVGAGIVGISSGPHIEIGFGPPFTRGGPMSSFLQQLMSGVTAPQIGMAGFAAGGAAPQIPLLRAKPIKGLGGVPAALANTASNVYAAALTGQINQALAATAGGLPASGGGNAAANQALALRMLPAFGWGADQMPYLIKLWNQESNWSQTALNQSSGAYGIPQSLPASKMASAGPDWRTNPATQIKWGLGYIKSTYGNPAGAWGHEVANNWYASGGRFPAWAGWNATGGTFVTRGPTLFGAGEGPRPERITVAPADNSSATGGRPIHIEIHHIIVNRKGDVQKIVDEELALLAASLRERQ